MRDFIMPREIGDDLLPTSSFIIDTQRLLTMLID